MQVFEENKDKSHSMTRAEFKNRSAVGKMFDGTVGHFTTAIVITGLPITIPARSRQAGFIKSSMG